MSQRFRGIQFAAWTMAGLIGVLAPISFARASSGKATAVCETCCPQKDSTCMICGTKSCSSYGDRYEARTGSSCESQS